MKSLPEIKLVNRRTRSKNSRVPTRERYVVKGVDIENTVYGFLTDALKEAVSIALLESDYPKKRGRVSTAFVNGPTGQFVITLNTPKTEKGDQ